MNHAAFFKSLPLSVSPLKMSNQSGHIIPGDVPAVAFAQVLPQDRGVQTGTSSTCVVEELSCVQAISHFQCHTQC